MLVTHKPAPNLSKLHTRASIYEQIGPCRSALMEHAPLSQRLARVWLNLPLSGKGAAIVTVPVLCTFCMLLLLADLQSKFDAANRWVLHTEQVLSQSGAVLASVLTAEDTARDYAL